jgi:DNA-binding Xre family transcriptional regulator
MLLTTYVVEGMMPVWNIEVTDQFIEWWDSLTVEEQESVKGPVNLLEQHGPSLARPSVDTIVDSRHPNMKGPSPADCVPARRHHPCPHRTQSRRRSLNAQTTKFSVLVDRARKDNPDWGANVGEYQRAAEDAMALNKLRESRKVTQVDLAAELGITQGNVSRMENRSEIYLSSLRSYIEALGGRLEITAVFDDDRVPVAVGAGTEATERQSYKSSLTTPA